jgi:hypothetical protein
MAMFVENYADAEGLLIMAEMPGNHPDNGVIVRVINSNNNSLVSMIFPAGSAFPSRVAITIAEDGLAGNGYEEGMEIVGDFTFYNYQTGKFSLTLSSEYESETLSNLLVNRDILDLHEDFTGLTRTQNARLRSIFTTMAIWDSIAYELYGEEDEIGARFIGRAVRRAGAAVFNAIAAVATFVAVKTASAFPIVSSAVTVIAGIAIWVAEILYPTTFYIQAIQNGNNHCSEQAESGNTRPKISIMLDGAELKNNDSDTVYWLDHGESLTFDIEITYAGTQNNVPIPRDNIIQMESGLFHPIVQRINRDIDPETGEEREQIIITVIPITMPNAAYFDISSTGSVDSIVQFTVARNYDDGRHLDGKVQFAIRFREAVIINDGKGGDFPIAAVAPLHHTPTAIEHLFILRFTVIEPLYQGGAP